MSDENKNKITWKQVVNVISLKEQFLNYAICLSLVVVLFSWVMHIINFFNISVFFITYSSGILILLLIILMNFIYLPKKIYVKNLMVRFKFSNKKISINRTTTTFKYKATQQQRETVVDPQEIIFGIERPPSCNKGSAKVLKGNIYTLICFISEANQPWQDAQKEAIVDFTKTAFTLIEKIARREWNVLVNFSNIGFLGLKQDIVFDRIKRVEDAGNDVWDILQHHGYRSEKGFYNWVRQNTNCEQVQIILFANCEGRSFAMPTIYESKEHFHEGTTIFNREDVIGVIIHEVLHLYGADDYYEEQAGEYVENFIQKKFPNSIMLKTWHNYNFTIDDYTAWLVGWHDNPKKWYKEIMNNHKRYKNSA
jgi:hypothetical protein